MALNVYQKLVFKVYSMAIYTISSPVYETLKRVPIKKRKSVYSFRETKKGLQLLKHGKFFKYIDKSRVTL